MTTRRGKSVSFLLCVRVGMEWPNIWLEEVALVVRVPVPEWATLFCDFLVLKTNATFRWLFCIVVYLKRKKKKKHVEESLKLNGIFDALNLSIYLYFHSNCIIIWVSFLYLSSFLFCYTGVRERERESEEFPFCTFLFFVILGSERERERARGFLFVPFFLSKTPGVLNNFSIDRSLSREKERVWKGDEVWFCWHIDIVVKL